MNYVNLENAKALKELGFDVPVTGYYFPDRLVSSDELRHDRFLSNFNHADFSRFSAPDFLTSGGRYWLLPESNPSTLKRKHHEKNKTIWPHQKGDV